MISDEQLIAWEAQLVEQNRFHWYGEVKALIDEIWRLKTAYENEVIKSVKLERDADWLAKKHWPRCPEYTMIDDCEDGMSPENCRKCWREYAREAVQND